MRDCECCEVTVLLCKVLCQFLFIVSALVKKEKKNLADGVMVQMTSPGVGNGWVGLDTVARLGY